MMMLGTNHLEVFDAIADWVEHNVPDQPGWMACSTGRKHPRWYRG